MNHKIVVLLILALALSWSVFAAAESKETVEQSPESEEIAEKSSEETVEQSSEQLPSGHGWALKHSAELGSSGKIVHMVLVDPKKYTDKTVYSHAITQLCRDEKDFCRVRFWTTERYVPEKISMSTEQRKHLKMEHTFDRVGNIHKDLVSCTVDPSRADCFN
jgi:hypothetical protein